MCILKLFKIFSSLGIIKGQESVAKDECWIDYEIIVDNKDAPSVAKIFNSYFSNPENRIEGVTYNLKRQLKQNDLIYPERTSIVVESKYEVVFGIHTYVATLNEDRVLVTQDDVY